MIVYQDFVIFSQKIEKKVKKEIFQISEIPDFADASKIQNFGYMFFQFLNTVDLSKITLI